ncbi:MAG: ATP-binding protein [Pseudomonadota bacterium]
MLRRFLPRSITGRLIAVLLLSFVTLLTVLAILEALDQKDAIDWAASDYATVRLGRIMPVIPRLRDGEQKAYINEISRCHEGYTLTQEPFPTSETLESRAIRAKLSISLKLPESMIRVGLATLTASDFSLDTCAAGRISLPVESVIISLRLDQSTWLNAEIHAHRWHFTPTITEWLIRAIAAFLVIGAVALTFVWRIGSPVNALAAAAQKFGQALQVDAVTESGPPDVRRLIQAFNEMQEQVAEELERRTTTLAAIGHDIRTPLTALRLKVELVDDPVQKSDLLASIEKMERMAATALEYLQGAFRHEEKKRVDLGSLVESECDDFRELGARIAFSNENPILLDCRPIAMARAVRNLIENAIKYAGHADIRVDRTRDSARIVVEDQGPGISKKQRLQALEPFERLSDARESEQGGFGLGLAIVKAIVEGHGGVFSLTDRVPIGLSAEIIVPFDQQKPPSSLDTKR